MSGDRRESVNLDDLHGRSGLEKLRALIAIDPMPGLMGSLGIKFLEIEEGWAVFEGVPGLHAYNPIGSVHGGYTATLLDSACGVAVQSRLGPSQSHTTLELKVAYHKAIKVETGPVRAEGRVVSLGRRVGFAEASLVGADGQLYASATSTLLIIDRRPASGTGP
jgi:uncharacterized protein (TIGR00369 family)